MVGPLTPPPLFVLKTTTFFDVAPYIQGVKETLCNPLHVGEPLILTGYLSNFISWPFSVQTIAAQYYLGRGRKALKILRIKQFSLNTLYHWPIG